jgi:phosphoglycolate phosphatase
MRDPALELLVFDWDGTLMDSVGSIVGCTQAVIAELGLGEADETTIRGTVGLGLRETVDTLVPGCDDALYDTVLECYRRHWVATFRDRPLLFPGVLAMLGDLQQSGYLLAVATGKSRRGLEHAFDQTGLRGQFHASRTADEALSKPHPQMLLDILDQLGVRPRAALMAGDSVYDLRMAANAGAHGAAVLSGAHGRAELTAESPRVLLEQIVELPAWLASENGLPAVEAAKTGELAEAADRQLAPAAIPSSSP